MTFYLNQNGSYSSIDQLAKYELMNFRTSASRGEISGGEAVGVAEWHALMTIEASESSERLIVSSHPSA